MRQSWSDDRIEKSIDDLRAEMREGFAALTKQIDERFKQVDERFKQVDARFEQVGSRLDRTDQRIGDVEQRLFQLLRGVFVVGGGLIGTLLLAIAGLFTSLN